jgi:hypothetical protein
MACGLYKLLILRISYFMRGELTREGNEGKEKEVEKSNNDLFGSSGALHRSSLHCFIPLYSIFPGFNYLDNVRFQPTGDCFASPTRSLSRSAAKGSGLKARHNDEREAPDGM